MTEWEGGIHGDWAGKLMKQGTLADVGDWATKTWTIPTFCT